MHGSSISITGSPVANTNQTLINTASSNLINGSITVQQFDTIRKWLLKHHKKYCDNDQLTNKNLLQFLSQFIQFQEDTFGKDAQKHTVTITRLPFEVLVDLGQGGALCHLFAIVFKYKYEQKM